MYQMRECFGASRAIIASRRSMLLWRISSTVAPLTRSWLAAIWTEAWTWWSSSTASEDSTSTGSVARWPSDVVGTTSAWPPKSSSSSASSSAYCGEDRYPRDDENWVP